MKNRLFYKIFLSSAIAMVLSIIIILALLSVTVSNYLFNEKKNLLIDNCSTISTVISRETDNSTNFYVSVHGIINVVSNAVSGDAYICDEKGNVFLCSCSEWKASKVCSHSSQGVPSSVLESASDGEFFEIGRLGNHFNNIHYTAATPFYNSDGTIAGYVLISSAASLLKAMWSELANIYVLCALLPIIVMFVAVFLITRKLVRPINLLSNAANNMAKGDFSARIPDSGNDEIADLAKSFNAMSNSLSQLESMRRSFVANVSHELRTPMTTIGGFIDGILDGTIPQEKHEHYLSIVSVEVKRLSRLVQSMLSLARLESGEQKANFTDVGLIDVIAEVLFSQEQRIEEKNLSIEGLEQGSDITVLADRDLIYQAIFNLTDNAIKFANESGRVDFSVFKDSENKVHIKVKNDGAGISPDALQYVFDRFYKADKSRSDNKDGTGLGLFIVKKIVDIHKATITVHSMPNSYTEFEIIFP